MRSIYSKRVFLMFVLGSSTKQTPHKAMIGTTKTNTMFEGSKQACLPQPTWHELHLCPTFDDYEVNQYAYLVHMSCNTTFVIHVHLTMPLVKVASLSISRACQDMQHMMMLVGCQYGINVYGQILLGSFDVVHSICSHTTPKCMMWSYCAIREGFKICIHGF